MVKAKKLTAPGKDKIVREVIELLKKHGWADHVQIYWSGKKAAFGNIGFEDDPNDPDEMNVLYTFDGPHITYVDPKTQKPWKASYYVDYCRDDTVAIVFDGGNLWDVLNDTYGYTSHNKFDEEMNKIIKPYGLYYEMCTSWALMLCD